MKPSIKKARSIVSSFTVNVKHHPEFITKSESGSVFCERNYKVALAIEAINNLSKEITGN